MVYELFSPKNSALLLIDYQVDTIFVVHSLPREEIKRNTLVLAKSAKALGMPIILTTSMEEQGQGKMMKELQEVIPEEFAGRIKRVGVVDCMDDPTVANVVQATGKKKLIMAGIPTEVSIVFPAMQAVRDGYEVQVVVDACGSSTKLDDKIAYRRMESAGVTLTSTKQIIAELAQNWMTEEGSKLIKILYVDILSKL
jgi:nicotinamidase-related amidase